MRTNERKNISLLCIPPLQLRWRVCARPLSYSTTPAAQRGRAQDVSPASPSPQTPGSATDQVSVRLLRTPDGNTKRSCARLSRFFNRACHGAVKLALKKCRSLSCLPWRLTKETLTSLNVSAAINTLLACCDINASVIARIDLNWPISRVESMICKETGTKATFLKI